MLKLVFLLILCGCLGFVYNQCPTCPYQNSPGGYNSPCSNGYLTPWCSQGTCYNNYCQYLPCYYNTYKNHPYGLNNIGIANKQLPFIQFTNNGNKFTNKPNNDPFGNAELEIIDHNSAPTTTGQIQQQQYPNYQQFFHNTMNFNQDPFANIPAEIIDEDELEEHGIDPKMVTSSHSSHSVNGGQQSVVTQRKTQPISATFTRSFTPQERGRFDENFVDGTKINETITTEIVTETSVVTTTEEDDEPAAVNSWLI